MTYQRPDWLPCARPDCGGVRAKGSPYCRAHKNEVALASLNRHKEKYAKQKQLRRLEALGQVSTGFMYSMISDKDIGERCQNYWPPRWAQDVYRRCKHTALYHYKGGKYCGYHTPGLGKCKKEPTPLPSHQVPA